MMKLYILEDDGNCGGVIKWLESMAQKMRVDQNIEDAVYHLCYEDLSYDKFIFDVSLPEAAVVYPDGKEREYNGALNGIDFLKDFLAYQKVDKRQIAILTAFDSLVKEYSVYKESCKDIIIINKNDDDLPKRLWNFLNMIDRENKNTKVESKKL